MKVMKRKIFITLLLLLLLTPVRLCAQEAKDSTKHFPLYLELGLGFGSTSEKRFPTDLNVNLGYQITKRFSVRALGELSYIIPKNGGMKDYNHSYNIGGGVGYVFIPVKDPDDDIYELRASYSTSVSGKDYKNNSYDIGLYWYWHRKSYHFAPVVGIGYKFMDFRQKGMPNYNGVFLSIGIRI